MLTLACTSKVCLHFAGSVQQSQDSHDFFIKTILNRFYSKWGVSLRCDVLGLSGFARKLESNPLRGFVNPSTATIKKPTHDGGLF
jgi:hypothetical protein